MQTTAVLPIATTTTRRTRTTISGFVVRVSQLPIVYHFIYGEMANFPFRSLSGAFLDDRLVPVLFHFSEMGRIKNTRLQVVGFCRTLRLGNFFKQNMKTAEAVHGCSVCSSFSPSAD